MTLCSVLKNTWKYSVAYPSSSLSGAGFAHLRNDNDANSTYEGDNNVLLQQTSNWLLGVWAQHSKGKSVAYPMGTVDYINHGTHILSPTWTYSPITVSSTDQGKTITGSRFISEWGIVSLTYFEIRLLLITSIAGLYTHYPPLPYNFLFVLYLELVQSCQEILQWLVCWLCREVAAHLQAQIDSGKDQFTARNNSQVFLAHTLSLVYVKVRMKLTGSLFPSFLPAPDKFSLFIQMQIFSGICKLMRQM